MKLLTKQNQRLAGLLVSLVSAAMPASAQPAAGPVEELQNHVADRLKQKVNHVIVIYQENWSFDSLYGQFPGVNGLQNAFDNLPQVDRTSGYSGYIYVTPQALNGGPDLRFPPGNGQPALPLIRMT